MASFSTLPLCTNSSFLPKPSKLFLHERRNQSFKFSCNAISGEHDKNNLEAVDRRNVLLGLGGLYGVANLAPLATAAPITSPDIKSCGTAQINPGGPDVPYSCCPPIPADMDTIPYYKLPRMLKLRKRPAAQNMEEQDIAKYQLAIRKMKELDKNSPDDPRGFKQQANVHCAYCNGAYKVGGKELQVHESWFFFPFHRWQLYFYERILGSLIDDPTFALPYWNWDNPKGMRLPPMFDSEGSSLYDARRNPNIRNGTIMDLAYFGDEVKATDLQKITNNLSIMYRQMITNAPRPLLFFGMPYRLGDGPKPGIGTIENMPHNPVHIWTGTKRGTDLGNGVKSYGEDLGNFYSAGLDPAFYCLHTNVDRLWNVWKTLGGKRRNITDEDWLNSDFFFYDENSQPWRVKVRDCLDHKRMGYDYEPTPNIWIYYKPQKKSRTGSVNLSPIKPASKVFPLPKLDRTISFCVERPATSRSQQEKDEKEEILTFKGVKYDNSKYIKFDVFLNVDNTVNADEFDKVEFAGSYTSLPHDHGDASHENASSEFKLAITELLEDIGLEDEDTIAVTVVPRTGGDVVFIESVEIELTDG